MYHDSLRHHGIEGQKWGVRRFQNEDGSLTSSGKKRYGVDDNKAHKGKKEKTNRELKYEIERAKLKNELKSVKRENTDQKLKSIAFVGGKAISYGSKFVAKAASKTTKFLSTPNGKKLALTGAVFAKTKSKALSGLTYLALSKHYNKKSNGIEKVG